MNEPVIIGSGIAGLSVALSLSPEPCILLARAPGGRETSSILAQGGIAAAIGPDDSPSFHAEDTLKAGGGLCDPSTVEIVTGGAAQAIERLRSWGVVFDRDKEGNLDLALEGAHSRHRIVHAEGDGTGAAVTGALIKKAMRTPSIKLITNAVATSIETNDDAAAGVTFTCDGESRHIPANDVILATGGIGALWPHTTNAHESWGHGLLLAARAGAELRDLEFVQFHPTAIDVGLDPMPLASESLRGEGARLIDDKGESVTNGAAQGDLAPRDIVTRAIWKQLQQGRRVFLDARMIPDFSERFPSVHALCAQANIDPTKEPIPIRPAAHYHMGGIATDASGRTSVKGLWACGEVAATGLHGANRLASNSLLEAIVFAQRIANSLKQETKNGYCHATSTKRSLPEPQASSLEPREAIRTIMETHVGVLRDKKGLEKAIELLTPLAADSDMALVGLMIATAALHREESRGAHCRTDFPNPTPCVLPAPAFAGAGSGVDPACPA